jgi:hypothetical protein
VIAAAAASGFELPGLWSLSPIGFALGVVALVYWLLVTGRLIPKSTHEALVGSERNRANEWRASSDKFEQVNTEIRKQNGSLIEANRVVESFLKASSNHLGDTQETGGR